VCAFLLSSIIFVQIQMDNMLISRDPFKETFSKIIDVHLLDVSEEPAMGAFQ